MIFKNFELCLQVACQKIPVFNIKPVFTPTIWCVQSHRSVLCNMDTRLQHRRDVMGVGGREKSET